MVLADEKHPDELVPVRAMFGLMPVWQKDPRGWRFTYNARSETIAEKNSFKHAWRARQFCLIPVDWFYEPRYGEDGKAVR